MYWSELRVMGVVWVPRIASVQQGKRRPIVSSETLLVVSVFDVPKMTRDQLPRRYVIVVRISMSSAPRVVPVVAVPSLRSVVMSPVGILRVRSASVTAALLPPRIFVVEVLVHNSVIVVILLSPR